MDGRNLLKLCPVRWLPAIILLSGLMPGAWSPPLMAGNAGTRTLPAEVAWVPVYSESGTRVSGPAFPDIESGTQVTGPAFPETGDGMQVTGTALSVTKLIELARNATNASRAVEYSERAILLADSMNEQGLKAHALHQSGLAWKRFGDLLTSEERLSASMNLFKTLGMELEAVIVLRELGDVYRAAGALDMAMETLRDAASRLKASGSELKAGIAYNRLASTAFELLYLHPDYVQVDVSPVRDKNQFFAEMQRHPEVLASHQLVLNYLDTASHYAALTRNDALFVSNEIIRAGLFSLVYDMERAVVIYDELMDFMHATGKKTDLPLVLINKARVLGSYRMNQPEQAIRLAHEALELAMEESIHVYIFMASDVLHNNYLAMGDYRQAYQHLMSAKETFEKFKSDQMVLRVSAQQYELQLMQREMEISNRRTQMRIVLLSAGILVIFFSVFLTILIRKSAIISGQNAELETANAEKDRLFSIIAHDLRGPFNTIMGYSEMLKEAAGEFQEDRVRKFAGQIHTSADQTLRLIDNLMEWAGMAQGRTHFAPRELALRDISEEVVRQTGDAAARKNISIRLDIPHGQIVTADPSMLRAILRNLLSNAVKFTPAGGTVTVSSESAADGTLVRVTDTGVGMGEEQLSALFKPETIVSTKGTANEKGTGLGLLLCKEFVDKHNGRIWAESEKDKGSGFIFILPA